MATHYAPSRYYTHREKSKLSPLDLFPNGRLTVLAGDPKAGKTTFLMALAIATATGQPFLGNPTVAGPVLWITGEEDPDVIFDMVDECPWDKTKIYPDSERPGILPFYTLDEIPDYNNFEERLAFEAQVRKIGPRLIVIDSLICSPNAHALNSDRHTRILMNMLSETARGSRCPMILVHHLSKKGNNHMSKSLQIEAAAWQNWFFRSDLLNDRRFIKIERKGRGRGQTNSLLIESRNEDHYALLDTLPSESSCLTLKQRILGQLTTEALTANELAEAIGEKPDTVQRNLVRLVNEGTAVRLANQDNAHRYAIRASDTSDSLAPRALPGRGTGDDCATGVRGPENRITTTNPSEASDTSAGALAKEGTSETNQEALWLPRPSEADRACSMQSHDTSYLPFPWEKPAKPSDTSDMSAGALAKEETSAELERDDNPFSWMRPDLSAKYYAAWQESEKAQNPSETSDTSAEALAKEDTSETEGQLPDLVLTPDPRFGKPNGTTRIPVENGFVIVPTYEGPVDDDEPFTHTPDLIRAEDLYYDTYGG